MLSTGFEEKPWICVECKSIVTILSAPAFIKISIITFAEMGTLGSSFLSCLEYPKYGITTLILCALALLAASISKANSTIWSAGALVD